MFSCIVTNIKLLYIKINPNYIKQCIENGDIKTIKKIVENGFDINTRFERGYTLLVFAANYLQYEIFEYLIKNGADVNVILDFGTNFLTNLFIYNICRDIGDEETYYPEYIKLLVEAGCNVNYEPPNKKTPLIVAIEYNNYEICELLVQHGADVNYKRYIQLYFDTPLDIVCISLFRIVIFMNQTNISNQLYNANELYKICVLLIENGADVLKKDENNHFCTYWIDNIYKFRQLYATQNIGVTQNIGDQLLRNELIMKGNELIMKMKTYLEEKIREREMLKTCFKRAHIDESDETDNEEEPEQEEPEPEPESEPEN